MHIRHESLELFVVVEDGIEKLEESFNDLYVWFSEVLVQFYQIYVSLNLRIKLILVLKVGEIEENLLIFLLLVLEKRGSSSIDHFSIDYYLFLSVFVFLLTFLRLRVKHEHIWNDIRKSE